MGKSCRFHGGGVNFASVHFMGIKRDSQSMPFPEKRRYGAVHSIVAEARFLRNGPSDKLRVPIENTACPQYYLLYIVYKQCQYVLSICNNGTLYVGDKIWVGST